MLGESGSARRAGGNRAFTLLELLVVLSIIVVLAALLLPTLAHAKTRTRTLCCLGNLRQWGLATLLFAGDHQDLLPRDGSTSGNSTRNGWYIDLPKSMGLPPYNELPWRTNAAIEPGRSVWICAANARRSNGKNLFHYCLNRHVNATGTGNQVRLGSIRRPTQTVWLFDNGRTAPVAQQNNVHTNLHSRGANFLFLDGHAARFANRDYWDFQRQLGITNHPNLIWIPR